MVVLFLIFIIQFSCSCAALAVNKTDQKHIIYHGWETTKGAAPKLLAAAQEEMDCCGSGIYDNYTTYTHPTQKDIDWSTDPKHEVDFKNGSNCFQHNSTLC